MHTQHTIDNREGLFGDDTMITKNTLRICKNGHSYFKSTDCPTCEENRKPQNSFLSLLAAPARRALENKGIKTLQQLSKFTEREILQLHGMGKSSIPKLKKAMTQIGLSFSNTK